MVRFSEIINIKDESENEDNSPEIEGREDPLWFSNSQIITERGDEITREIPGSRLRDHASVEVVKYFEKFIESAREIREKVIKDQGISPSPVLADLHYIIDNELIDELNEYAMSSPDNYDWMLLHTVSVTIASLKIGRGMGYDTKGLLELGLAAFLENVGMYKIPDFIPKKKEKLKKEEISFIKQHSNVSFQILSNLGRRYGWLADVALQVHERADGSGYPKGLSGQEILEMASIIGLIDTYIAMTEEKPYREKYLQSHAVNFIIKETKKLFPPQILKIFLNQISLFPVNSYVRLNNQSIGRVESTNENQPLRPSIEVLFDGLSNKVTEREVLRLTDNPLLYVTESIDQKELP
jgi:HD-GYP domain-containing protein (c-di-GMP phosphodiesterase class II)